MPTIDQLVRHGSSAWNALRESGQAPRDHIGATFEDLAFANTDFSNLNLVGSEWGGCVIGGVDFRNTDLSNAYLHDTRFERCDFRDASFEGACLEQVQFVSCKLAGLKGLNDAEREGVELTDCDDEVEAEEYEQEAHRVPGLVAVNEALEASIDAALDDEPLRLVHGDWLMAQGDVRGELVLAGSGRDAEDLRDELLETLLGELADAVRGGAGSPSVELKWRFGLIDRASFFDEANAEWASGQLLSAACARFVRALSWPMFGVSAVVPQLVGSPARGAIRSLAFGVNDRAGSADFSSLWSAVPRLESLTLRGEQCIVGRLRLPALKTLHIEVREPGDLDDALAREQWPHLELLTLSGVRLSAELLANAPSLTHLSLPRAPSVSWERATFGAREQGRLLGALELILASPHLSKLRTVDLSSASLSTSAAQLILANQVRLSALEHLMVSNTFDGRERQALDALPFVIFK